MSLTVEQLDDMEAEIREAIDRVRTILTVRPARRPERMVTADAMKPGGRVRFPAATRPVEIEAVAGPRPGDPETQRYISWKVNGSIVTRHVSSFDEYPYWTAAEYDDHVNAGEAFGKAAYHANVQRLRRELADLNGDAA